MSEILEILHFSEKSRDPYEELAALAVPVHDGRFLADPAVSNRLDDRLTKDGKLTWPAPAGEWTILRFVAKRSGEHLKIPSPTSDGTLVDHLSGRTMEARFNHILDTIGRGRDGFGPLKVLMLDSYEVKPTVDWTNGFSQEFQKRHGCRRLPVGRSGMRISPNVSGMITGNRSAI